MCTEPLRRPHAYLRRAGVLPLGVRELDHERHLRVAHARLAIVRLHRRLRLAPLAELDERAACARGRPIRVQTRPGGAAALERKLRAWPKCGDRCLVRQRAPVTARHPAARRPQAVLLAPPRPNGHRQAAHARPMPKQREVHRQRPNSTPRTRTLAAVRAKDVYVLNLAVRLEDGAQRILRNVPRHLRAACAPAPERCSAPGGALARPWATPPAPCRRGSGAMHRAARSLDRQLAQPPLASPIRLDRAQGGPSRAGITRGLANGTDVDRPPSATAK